MVISFLLVLGGVSVAPGQDYSKDDLLRFAQLLYENEDYSRASYEYLRVFHLFENSESEKLELNLKIGKCLGFLNQPDKADQFFRYCLTENPPGNIYHQALIQMGFLLFKQGRYEQSRSLLEEKKTSPSNSLANTLILANVLCQGDVKKARESFKHYQNQGMPYVKAMDKYLDILSGLKFKSPLQAALMSAILPGSGRIYAGRVKEGILSLVGFLATSYLAYEGFHEDGLKSFKGWLFSSIGTFLYIGNIYGSVLSARLTNDRLREGFNKGIELSLKIVIND